MNEHFKNTDIKYYNFTSRKPIKAYFLNFTSESTSESIYYTCYFLNVDTNEKIITKIPFFPSFIIECYNIPILEELLLRDYEMQIYYTDKILKNDLSQLNHLNKPPKEYLRLYFKNEFNFKKVLKELKEKEKKQKNSFNIIKNKANDFKIVKHTDVINKNQLFQIATLNNKDSMYIQDQVIKIHEYDIVFDILFLCEHNLRCGQFYEMYFDNTYKFKKIDLLVPPQITILAFDIETTKQPLKFPNPKFDQVMMISMMINNMGLLIVNSDIVKGEIKDFEYTIPDKKINITFQIFICNNEKELLIKFQEIINTYKPDIITSYNGDFFDIPFIQNRYDKHNIIFSINIPHLDCFKWVKRDSYLPMGSQGLKAVTRIKLGYIPDEIDPEEIVNCAKHDSSRLAIYSVSDAIATYFLYIKYVHPFIFSLCTLIPLAPMDVLSKGSGTLCESLLIAEALLKAIIIPNRNLTNDIRYEGMYTEDVSYVGGHVECLKSGIYRNDFKYDFVLKKERIDEILKEIQHPGFFNDIVEEKLMNSDECKVIDDNINDDIVNANDVGKENIANFLSDKCTSDDKVKIKKTNSNSNFINQKNGK